MKKHIFHLIPLILQPLLYLPVLCIFKLCTHFKVEGQENLKGLKGKVIIASNHASEWDPILIRAAFPLFTRFAPFYFVSAPKENFKTFGWKYFIYGGFLFEIFGAYSIHPGHHDYRYSLHNHLEILKQDNTLCIFPQGKRVIPGEESPAHGGVAYLAHETKATVLPIHIEGTYEVNAKILFSGRHKVTLTIKKPMSHLEIIDPAHTTVEDFKRGGEKVLEKIML
jgi:1-acyl-sn-glycerol-3-phosphate acyltransferase